MIDINKFEKTANEIIANVKKEGMKEQDIIDLGFTKQVEEDFYYYVYDLARGLSLITSANDEVVDNKWFVEVFETDPTIRFTNKGLVEALIIIINNGKINE